MRRDSGWLQWRPITYFVSPAVRLDVGWRMWEPITYVVITEDTEQDLFGVRDDLGPEDTDVSYFDTLDDYPPDWIWV